MTILMEGGGGVRFVGASPRCNYSTCHAINYNKILRGELKGKEGEDMLLLSDWFGLH